MFVILSYDISSKKGKKVLRECRRMLLHVQKSLFEGEITEKRLNRLKDSIARTIDPTVDSVVIYRFGLFPGGERESIGISPPSSNTIL